LHHFHFGVPSKQHPKGRSAALLFAEVLDTEFRVIAISNHGVFQRGSAEQARFFSICRAYSAKDIPAGQAFMANPVMSSGHSMVVVFFADRCEELIEQVDSRLNDPSFVDSLYNEQPILVDGKLISRPSAPQLSWHFEDLKFGLLDKTTGVFFCFLPYFSR